MAISKPQDNTWSVVARWVTLFAQHFRQALTDLDFEIYEQGLQGASPERIAAACQRCLEECAFMPRVADIRARLPEAEAVTSDPPVAGVTSAGEVWSEVVGGVRYHYQGDPRGYRRVVRVERIGNSQQFTVQSPE